MAERTSGIGRLPIGEHTAMVRELAVRDHRWTAALTRARHQLAECMSSISRLGRYAR